MTQSSKKWIIFLLKTILMGAIVYYIVSGIDFEQFSKSIYEYGIIPLGIGAALLVFNDFVQGMRWRYLTRNQCSLMASFESIVVGGFLNMILPAKLGEVSRLIYLRNIYNYPFNYGVGVMVIERGADLFMVACFMALGAGMATGNLTMEWISIFLIFGMIGIVFWIKNDRGALFMKLLKRLPFRLLRTYSKKIIRLIIKDIGSDRLGKVILYTLVLRGFYFITVAYFLNGVASLDLSVSQMFIVYLISSIAFAIPLAPGGVGTFHAGFVMAMGWYDVEKEKALAIAVVFHLLLNIVPVVLGVLIMVMKKVSITNMVHMEERRNLSDSN